MPRSDLQISEITGRRRKLTDGQMIELRKLFAEGESVRDLSKMFGVSSNVVYAVCYWTRRTK